MLGQIKDIGLTLTGEIALTISLPRQHIEELTKLKDEQIDVTIKKYRERRSLSQNAYAWILITKIAQSMRPPLNKEEVYVEMLKRYGQGGIVTVRKDKTDVLRAFDYYEEKGQGTTNGKEFWHMMVYVGSSKYNSAEMSIFIDGIVSEAKDLGIETLSPSELMQLEGIR